MSALCVSSWRPRLLEETRNERGEEEELKREAEEDVGIEENADNKRKGSRGPAQRQRVKESRWLGGKNASPLKAIEFNKNKQSEVI